ncbi:MAG: hypothetical protein J6U23_05605 [Clostridiales bacterium]|nr:hypothetical protein [Clostridiales bacterium]
MIESGYFMNAIRRSLEMVKGDTLSFGFEVKGLKGQRPEAVQFSCKDKLEDTGYVFAVSLADTIDFRSYDAENDILTYGVRVPPNKTAGIYAGSYFYDLELRVNGDVITLMIGRLQIDEQITNSAVPPSPSYEDGDNTLYPVQDIPEGRKKAYSEQAVSDIATQLEETLDEYLGYKVGDMAPAVETIKFAISNINEATKTLTDSTENYTLSELAPAIASVTRGDDIYYPVSNPQGTKVYKELDIDSIGIAIQRLLGTTDKFRLKDMDYAIYSAIPERTKSGAVVSISDGAIDTPISGGKVYVSPVQSGTGTPAPDNVRPISGFTGSTLKQVGKNLLKNKKYQATTNFLYLGVDDNSTYMLKAGTYTISALTTKWVSFSYAVSVSYTGITTTSFTGGYKGTFTLSEDTELVLRAYNSDGLLPTDISDVMLEVGSSNSDYVEYIEREIAPISWEAEAGTIYAGYKDLKTGKVFATWKSVTYTGANTESWNKEDISGYPRYKIFVNDLKVTTSGRIEVLSNIGIFASGNAYGVIYGYQNQQLQKMIYYYSPSDITTVDAFKTWLGTHNLQVLYPIDPIEYDGDPVSGIYTMLGDNTFFNNTGDTEITYSADIKKLVESLD